MKRFSIVLALVLFAAGNLESQNPRYRILISNDDGIQSEGIAALATELSTFAEVVVVAPDDNESGASHRSIIRTQITTLSRVERDGRAFGYSVNASPADAVKFGLLYFGDERPFDLVVSGINAGANVGMIAHTSGTVGAAMEAVIQGVPAVAVSQGSRGEYDVSARFAGQFVRQVLEKGAPQGIVLSINVPSGDIRGVRITPMGGFYFRVAEMVQTSEDGDAGATQFRARTMGEYGVEPGSDSRAYLDGYITVTPLRADWTDQDMIAELATWQLQP